MRLAMLGFLCCLCLCAQQAALDGVTVDATTQMPLPGVHVSLISMGVATNLPEPDDAYGAISDAAGHYSIGNIRPGTYILNPRHAGFVYTREKDVAATPTIILKTGEQNSGYRIVMTPEATITGRVVDEFGDPVQAVGVRAVPAADASPYGAWTMRGETDDRGEYRISGIPGKYYIEASVHPLETSGPPEIRTDGSSTTAYATTYYPGSLAKERAKVVEIAAGQELAGIDFHVAHRKSLQISGVVTGPHETKTRATVTIRIYYDGSEADDSKIAAADGSFTFAGLAPAEYHLQATWPSGLPGGDTLQSPSVKVTVENEDATVNLPVTAGERMAGTLQIEGDQPGEPREMRTVRLTPIDLDGVPTKGGQTAPDGSFVIGGILPDKYRLTIDPLSEKDPLSENVYIKSLLVGGAEAVDSDLDFTKGVGGSTIKITLSRKGGQVSGSIADKDGRRVIDRHLFVILAADVNSFVTWRTATTSDSTFAIYGIRPGKYRLFAVDPVQFGSLHGYEPLKAIAARADEIEIKEDDRIAKEIRVSGKDDAGAK